MDWKALGAKLGTALANILPDSAKERVRASYAAKYGRCRRCDAPLAGPSPDHICEPCHADELLERAGGGKPTGDA